MSSILEIHEAEVQQVKKEQRRCKDSTLKSFSELYKLLRNNDETSRDKENIEEQEATVETVARI